MIVFDFDGVISDSLETCTRACKKVAARQGSIVELSSNPFWDLCPVTFAELAQSLGLEPKSYVQEVNTILHSEACFAPIFEGMPEVISTLSAQIPIAVLSASKTQIVKSYLHQHQLLERFQTVVGGDLPGTKSEKLKQIQDQAHGPVLAMVGDSVSDIEAGKSLPTSAVGVGWGWQCKTRLLQAGADQVAETPEALLGILQNLSSGDRTGCERQRG